MEIFWVLKKKIEHVNVSKELFWSFKVGRGGKGAFSGFDFFIVHHEII